MVEGQTAVRYQQETWDLSELLAEASEEEIARRLAELEERVRAVERHRSALSPELSPQTLWSICGDFERLVETSHVLAAFGSLWFASDTQSQAALTYRNRLTRILTTVENRVLFLSLWWKSLDDETAERLLPSPSEAPDLRHFLLDLRRFKPFTLDERSEQIINLKDSTGMETLLTLYSMLTNRLEFRLEVDGEERVLTRDELMSHAFSPRAERRETAYRELLRVYEGEAAVLAQIYVNRVRDWHAENVELRGFASPLAVRNAANDVPDRAVELLLEVGREHAPLFQRYFRLKAGWLGLPRLRRFDLYAPLATSDRSVPYAEGVELVLETFARFHPRFAASARRVFERCHIDSEIRKGKKGGAFCSTVLPRQTPWVLVNYTGRVRDVATLAHELGHAVHSMLAEHHSVLTQHPSLPLAETASVFAEMLVTERLLAGESDPAVRRELLAAAVDDVYATVLRQLYFVLFEKEAHQAVLDDRSPDDLDRTYLAGLREQFGESVEVGEEFRREWVGIPHIYHTPFYCYAYSFGQLLVLSLYRRYQEEGEAFKPRYLRLLSHGGAARPANILAEVGVDMTDPEFWRGGFQVVRGMIEDLETLEG